MIKTNKDKLAMMSIQGTVAKPASRGSFGIDSEGKQF